MAIDPSHDDSLGDHLRQFVTWRYDEETPLDEMAMRSGSSVPAVKKPLWKIRQRLQHCVESNKVGPEGGQVLTERTVEAIKALWPNN